MAQNYRSWYVLHYCGWPNNQIKLNSCFPCFQHATKQQKEIGPVSYFLSLPTNKSFKTMPLKNLDFQVIGNLWESFYIVHKQTVE